MRYTEYHAGKAVIKNKSQISGAMEKLATLEDLEEARIPETICDEYCKYPDIYPHNECLEYWCNKCKLNRLMELLT